MSGGSHTENRRRARRLQQTLLYHKQLDEQQKKLLKYYDLINENKTPQVTSNVILQQANHLEQRKMEINQTLATLRQAPIVQARFS